MRELLDELGHHAGSDSDPLRAARAAQRKPLPKRFYEAAAAGQEPDGGWTIRLDGRAVRTPARRLLRVEDPRLAQALADEWAAQGQDIDPSTMPLTRLVNVALDGVTDQIEASRTEVMAYAGCDLLCYRAGEPERLVERQGLAWDPILARFRDDIGAHFLLSAGLRHVTQAPDTLDRVAVLVPRDPLPLAALVSMTGLTGSALLALAVLVGWIDADAAWHAAHVDEDWNRDLWGDDAEARARRALRKHDMDAAALVMAHAGHARADLHEPGL